VTTEEQVKIIEAQIHSPVANFTLMEKMQYLTDFFGPDPDFSQEAMDIVRGNISKPMNRSERRVPC
jgi:hypothetical protein